MQIKTSDRQRNSNFLINGLVDGWLVGRLLSDVIFAFIYFLNNRLPTINATYSLNCLLHAN